LAAAGFAARAGLAALAVVFSVVLADVFAAFADLAAGAFADALVDAFWGVVEAFSGAAEAFSGASDSTLTEAFLLAGTRHLF
jgi:hypothetical protein